MVNLFTIQQTVKQLCHTGQTVVKHDKIIHAISQVFFLFLHTVIEISHKSTNKHRMGEENNLRDIGQELIDHFSFQFTQQIKTFAVSHKQIQLYSQVGSHFQWQVIPDFNRRFRMNHQQP